MGLMVPAFGLVREIMYFYLDSVVYKRPVAKHPHKLGNSVPFLSGFVSRSRVICDNTN